MPDAVVEAPPETTAPPQSTDGSMTDTDAYAALDAMVETPATPQASAATEKIDTNHPEQKPKPEVKAPKDTVKPEVKEPVNEPVKPAEPQKPIKAKTLAEAKEMAQAEAKEWRQKYEALQKEAAKAKDDPEKKTLAERLAEREKRLADIEEELKYTNFEKTEEFKDRYQKPFLTAYEKGRKFVSQLQVVERKEQFDVEGETRERVLQPGRQATAADFDAVMRLYNFNPAEGSKLATQLFGEMAPDVKDYIRDTQRLYEAQESAKEEFRAKGSEREKAMGETHKRMAEEVTSAFNQALEMGPKKWPDRYGPKEGDFKGNELLTKGMMLAQRAFTDGRAFREGDKDLSPVELARLRGAIVNQAGAYPRALYLLNQANSQLKELQEKLSQYESSEPGPGGGKKVADKKAFARTMDAVLDSMGEIAQTI